MGLIGDAASPSIKPKKVAREVTQAICEQDLRGPQSASLSAKPMTILSPRLRGKAVLLHNRAVANSRNRPQVGKNSGQHTAWPWRGLLVHI